MTEAQTSSATGRVPLNTLPPSPGHLFTSIRHRYSRVNKGNTLSGKVTSYFIQL